MTGKFQINYTQNAFLNAVRNIIITKKVPRKLLNIPVELSPVDECAKSINIIISSDSKNKIYHIVNNYTILVKDFIKIINRKKYNIQIVDMNDFIKAINRQNEVGKQYIKEYILANSLNKYSCKNTIELLNENHFNWSKIDDKYINLIMKLIKENRW